MSDGLLSTDAFADVERVGALVPTLLAYLGSDLCIRYSNPAYQQWFGAGTSVLTGRHLRAVLGDALFAGDEPFLLRALQGTQERVDRRLKRPQTGEEGDFSVGYFPDVRNGVVSGLVIEATDVTALKEAERLLRSAAVEQARNSAVLMRREASLAEAQRLGQIGSWEWEIDTDIVIWSDQMYRLFGEDPSRLPLPFRDHQALVTPESWQRLSAAVANCRATGAPYLLDIVHVSRAGGQRRLEVRGEAVKGENGVVISVRGTTQDISNLCRREEVDLLHGSIDRLLKGLSEQVRQYLNGAMGAARLIQMEYFDGRATRDRWLAQIISGGEALSRMFSEEALAKRLRDETGKSDPSRDQAEP